MGSSRRSENVRQSRTAARIWLVVLALALGTLLPLAGAEPLRVALTGRYPPFSMYDGEGELVGFDVDVSRQVAKRLDRPLVLVPTEWDGILPGLLAGHYDAIIGSMAITPERQEQVAFSAPYYISGAQLFVHHEVADEIAGIEDCAGRRIAANLGETYERFLNEHHPDVELVAHEGTENIFLDMDTRRIDGFVTDRLLGAHQIKQYHKPYVQAGPLLYEERMAIPVRQGEAELLAAINAALADMRRAGILQELHAKWFRKSRDQSRLGATTVARLLLSGFVLTLLIAGAAILGGFVLAVPTGAALNGAPWPLRIPIRAVVDFVRGTPVLIQLFFVYFGLPVLLTQAAVWLGFDWRFYIPPLTAAILTLGVSAAAYMAEVVRSGLMAVDPGQREAARALGLSRWQTFFHVVWPQAFRIAIPPLMNSVVALIKDTALVSVITVPEVVRQTKSIISVTYEPGFYYLIVAAMFFAVTFPLMKLAGLLERRIRARGFSHD